MWKAWCLGGTVLTLACSPAPLPPGAIPSAGDGLTLPLTWADCAAGPDSDADGLSDLCEAQIARAFAPVLVVAAGGCDWDSSVSVARLGGEYPS